MNLSKRLEQIDQMIVTRYDHIWDCCCDHGLLGMHLLERNAGQTIHFVDSVKPLIDTLASQLLAFDTKTKTSILSNRWQVHCLNAANIITQHSDSNLVIISGVGGELIIDLVKAILKTNAKQALEFILCPVHHNYKVRKSLIDLGLGLVNEKLVKENHRFYEVIHVATTSTQTISAVGSMMWNFTRQDDLDYLNQTIAHYRRMQNSNNKILLNTVHTILKAYECLGEC